MNNQLKSKTRLAFIQVVFQHISTKNDIYEILDIFDKNYKSTSVDNFNNKKKIKFEFNSNFLRKLINCYNLFITSENYLLSINKFVNISRKFEKWDLINQSILLAALCELKKTDASKMKIVFNDYINISKSFVNHSDIGIINAILDKLINDQK
jgi:transcription termination factor NusB